MAKSTPTIIWLALDGAARRCRKRGDLVRAARLAAARDAFEESASFNRWK